MADGDFVDLSADADDVDADAEELAQLEAELVQVCLCAPMFRRDI